MEKKKTPAKIFWITKDAGINRILWYLILTALLSAFCFITLHVWLLPYSVAFSETGVMTPVRRHRRRNRLARRPPARTGQEAPLPCIGHHHGFYLVHLALLCLDRSHITPLQRQLHRLCHHHLHLVICHGSHLQGHEKRLRLRLLPRLHRLHRRRLRLERFV